MRLGHPDEYPATVLCSLRRLKDGVGAILNDLKDLAIAIATGEHGLLRAEVLSDKLGLYPVDSEDFAAISLHVSDERRVRRRPPRGCARPCFVSLQHGRDSIGAPARIEVVSCEPGIAGASDLLRSGKAGGDYFRPCHASGAKRRSLHIQPSS